MGQKGIGSNRFKLHLRQSSMYWPVAAPRVFASRRPLLPQQEGEQSQDEKREDDLVLLGLQVSRKGHLFATATKTSLDIWQSSPVVVLASIVRSSSSLKQYGQNVSVHLRPDGAIVVLQTSLGFLMIYDVTIDPNARVYQVESLENASKRNSNTKPSRWDEFVTGQSSANIDFRQIIKVDAGIGKTLALDDDLVIATQNPAAIQCIRWKPDGTENTTITEPIHRLPWMDKKSAVTDLIYDRAMSLYVWITVDGDTFAVQRIKGASETADSTQMLFCGYGFHIAGNTNSQATKAAINARFSLLAVGCASGEILVYHARDYAGNLPLSHKLRAPASLSTTGCITFLAYSPDGYCLFVGFERGWVIWSVYGKMGGNSFVSDPSICRERDEYWLLGTQDGSWIRGGSEILFTTPKDRRLWALELAKNAMTGCFGPANASRMLLHTNSYIMVYRGHDARNLVSVSTDASLWHQAQIPRPYLTNYTPIRCAVISSDGRYVAVAGQRGLAHYSVRSRRWRTFENEKEENSFIVRGGMCWHQHILIAAVETDEDYGLRLYSRELSLADSSIVFSEQLSFPIVIITPIGEDSLLVYTYENVLLHYAITVSGASVQLIQVGKIGLQGIVRAPARVRAVTWVIPDDQLHDGDLSQDVLSASVIVLVDAKLVLLQPPRDNSGKLKYDMRIIANDVEFYTLARDQLISPFIPASEQPEWMPPKDISTAEEENPIQDSLWYFDGTRVQCWTDIQELLNSVYIEGNRDAPLPVPITTDFYPTAFALDQGVLIGLESDLACDRDEHFATFRYSVRTHLFLPSILQSYLSDSASSSAFKLSNHYQRLSYFSHALEVLLHNVLDAEVDTPCKESPVLPVVLSFLSSFPNYLDILVQCTRKSELRSWKTLFTYLPPPRELFEESLEKGFLKTAGNYLLVLVNFEELDVCSEYCIRLLQKAKEAADWDLCKELARFLMALDNSGDSLRKVLENLKLTPDQLQDQ